MATTRIDHRIVLGGGLVGALVLVEVVSGALQSFYLPLVTPIARYLEIRDADWNWFEAAQTLVAAVSLPVLARLGDLFGHRRILLATVAVVAGASWGVAFAGDYWTFLIGWALQAFLVVWLPLEIALVFDRARRLGRPASATRKAAGVLVVGLEVGAIGAALLGGRMFTWLGGSEALDLALSAGVTAASVDAVTRALTLTLIVPAMATTVAFFVVLLFVPKSPPNRTTRTLDGRGLGLLAGALFLIMGALSLLRVLGPASALTWIVLAAGTALLVPFVRHELRHRHPAIDLRLLLTRPMWPVQLAAGLLGVAILGTQVPLVTFASTDPSAVGYGLGMDSAQVSLIMGLQLATMAVAAGMFPILARVCGARWSLAIGAALMTTQYVMIASMHASLVAWIVAVGIGGLGGGLIAAGIPAAAAAAAPPGRTGISSGMTNTHRTIGGAFASAIFALALSSGDTTTTASPLSGYFVVWLVAAAATASATVVLFFLPVNTLRDAPEVPEGAAT
ncbi:MFS transporter [Microbacterium sp. BWT-B31]|uniref:MFS transporter n=1 Tax=Microbacterium sp. BWT-B31 TaxID=3232072 RepID=UPI0035288917